MKRNYIARRKRGTISTLILLLMVMVVVVGAAFSYDYSHGLVVKESLQNATDAGALAGVMELAKDNPTAVDLTNAELFAKQVAAFNKADNELVTDTNSNTVVNVHVNSVTTPRTVTVTATKNTSTLFARLIGWNTMPVTTTSTASANRGIIQVKSHQLYPMAVSLDYRPENGPQKDISLQETISPGQPFTIVLNPQNSKNSAWLQNWQGKNNPPITLGQDTVTMNGVQASNTKALTPGQTINLPVVNGGPPFNDARQVVGVIGFQITKINFPLSIEGYIRDPIIIRGVPGLPTITGLTLEGLTFLSQHQPWHVSLTN